MKKRQEKNSNNNNVENEKLKSLAKDFVSAAIEEGLNATKIYEVVRVVWNELIDEAQPKFILSEESEGEKAFREKAIKLLQDNPKIQGYCQNVDYVEDGEEKSTNATLELLCAMHKVFNLDSEEAPSREYVKNLAKQRLKAIAGKDYAATSELDKASRRITAFHKENYLKRVGDKEFAHFSKQYCSRKNTISDEILAFEWYINKY